jgi:putative effector of murein hydrolase
MIIAWLSLPLELLCLLVLKLIKSYLYKGQYLYDKYRQKLMWRQPITIFTESCTILVMCCLINLKYPNYFRWGDTLSTVLSIVTTCLIVGQPILFAVFMYRNFSNLRNKKIESKFGAIYENLNVNKGKSIIN